MYSNSLPGCSNGIVKMKTEEMSPESYLREHHVPDRSKSDYYCEICDSHMNSEQIWEAHINGKRHIKNLKKDPSELTKNKKFIKKSDSESYLFKKLVDINEPIIGLDSICEIQQTDPVFVLNYRCYLCHCSCTYYDIVDHLVTLKHRLAYLSHADPGSYTMIDGLRLTQEAIEPIVKEKCAELEYARGRGLVEVKVEVARWERQLPKQVNKRPFNSLDDDDGDPPSKKAGILAYDGKFQFTDFMDNLPQLPGKTQIAILKNLCTPDVLVRHDKKTLFELMDSLLRTLKRMPSHNLSTTLREGIREMHNFLHERRHTFRTAY